MREFGSEFCVLGNERSFFSSFSSFSAIELLSSGREALGLVAELIDLKGSCILLPSYCCSSMFEPFSKRGWTIIFYSLNDNLSVNESEVLYLCEKHAPKAVLLMNFFGIAPTDLIASKIKTFSEEVFIIEDFTHVLFSKNVLSNKYVDFFVASIRKWMGIFDGAIVLSNKSIIHRNMTENTEFINFREEAQTLKFEYSLSKDVKLKDRYLDLLKKAEVEINKYDCIHSISKSSLKMLNSLNINTLTLSRKVNFNHLFEEIRKINGIRFPFRFEDNVIECPFSLPILVDDRDIIQKQFANNGLYAPVLWPINTQARNLCPVSSMMSDSMLSIPIDQRYDYDDIEDIIRVIKSVIIKNN